MGTIIDDLRDAVDALVAADPTTLADVDALVELARQHSRLDAVLSRSAAALEASGRWRCTRSRSAAAWLAFARHLPIEKARQWFGRGRAMRSLPAAEAAWMAGDIDGTHLDVLKAHAEKSDRTRTAMVRDESTLVVLAATTSFNAFRNRMRYWYQTVDEDGADGEEQRRHESREAFCSQSFEGMWFGDFTLDPIGGSIFSGELERLADAMFHDEWAAAKEALGRNPHIDELERTPRQRRADAMVEMASRSRAFAGTSRAKPLFTVLVGYETLHGRICELADGTVIAPSALLPWLDQALVERVVFDAKSRPIDVSHKVRLYTGATRRAVEIRDRKCFECSCEERFEGCDVDHIELWAAGGWTITANGRLACPFHNRNRHQRYDDDDAA